MSPRDAKLRSLGRIFASYPHTNDRFLYSGPEIWASLYTVIEIRSKRTVSISHWISSNKVPGVDVQNRLSICYSHTKVWIKMKTQHKIWLLVRRETSQWVIWESPAQFENQIKSRVYVRRITGSTKGPPGVWRFGENGYLFSGGWGALVIILGIWGACSYFGGFGEPCKKSKIKTVLKGKAFISFDFFLKIFGFYPPLENLN